MTAVLDFALVACIVILAYAWVGYPLILRVLSLCSRRPALPLSGSGGELPAIAVLVAAHNEAEVIGQRLDNLLRLEYAGRIRIYVGDDASEDSTAAIVSRMAQSHPEVVCRRFENRRGKAAVLKDLVQMTTEPILVMTDANTSFDPDAVKRLLSHFGDPRIGGVCGRLAFEGESETEEGHYWQWETSLKRSESLMDSCLGANGAIYAIRRGLFWQAMPDNTIIDDFVIGMKVREQGFCLRYDALAVAREMLPSRVADEWRRRVRIGAGAFQALRFCRRCLLPGYGAFAWAFWSHKVLRWFTPHLLLATVLLSATVMFTAVRFPEAGHGAWATALSAGILALSLVGVLGAIAGRWVRRSEARLTLPLRACHYFLVIQAALFVGFIRFCQGNLTGHWVRTPRGT